MNVSEEELREMKQLSEWQRMSVSDVVRAAIRKLYMSELDERIINKPKQPKKG
jgi:Arc/MetJ-type ribon-helix-helix transcriptional regulator